MEKGIFPSQNSGFESKIRYRDYARAPHKVAGQTHHIIELICCSQLPTDEFPRSIEYLKSYTVPYLKSAVKGSDVIFQTEEDKLQKKGAITLLSKTNSEFSPPKLPIDKETIETASHAYTIFSVLSDIAESPFFPKGFSRKGFLAAPEDRNTFIRRVQELWFELWRMTSEPPSPDEVLEADIPRLRMYWFFKAGELLKIDLPECEMIYMKEYLGSLKKKRENLNILLQDINALDNFNISS